MKALAKNKWFLLSIIVFAILFFWFEIRPARVRGLCVSQAARAADEQYCSRYPNEVEKCNRGTYLEKDYEFYYENCLNKYGVK